MVNGNSVNMERYIGAKYKRNGRSCPYYALNPIGLIYVYKSIIYKNIFDAFVRNLFIYVCHLS